jgi:hypothetical protein
MANLGCNIFQWCDGSGRHLKPDGCADRKIATRQNPNSTDRLVVDFSDYHVGRAGSKRDAGSITMKPLDIAPLGSIGSVLHVHFQVEPGERQCRTFELCESVEGTDLHATVPCDIYET